MEAVFSCFLALAGGPSPFKSSQNAVMVCKNEGLHLFKKNGFSYENELKMTPLGTPTDPPKTEKVREKTYPKSNQQNA